MTFDIPVFLHIYFILYSYYSILKLVLRSGTNLRNCNQQISVRSTHRYSGKSIVTCNVTSLHGKSSILYKQHSRFTSIHKPNNTLQLFTSHQHKNIILCWFSYLLQFVCNVAQLLLGIIDNVERTCAFVYMFYL